MTGLVFLSVALVLSLVGSAVLYLRHRKPRSLDHGISSFQREMQALSPDARWRDSG